MKDERRAKVGRPTECTPENTKTICAAISRGAHFRMACRLARVSYSAAREWRKRGEAGEKPYKAFVEAIELAKSECEADLLAVVVNAAIEGGDIRAAQWNLEKLFPQRYAPRQQLEHKVKPQGGGPNLEVLSNAERAKVFRALAEREERAVLEAQK